MKSGFQQIMLPKAMKKKEEGEKILPRLKKGGYQGIELCDYLCHRSSLVLKLITRLGGMPVYNIGSYDWKKLIDESGLEVFSYHTDLDTLEKHPEKKVQEAYFFHTDKIVITGMYNYPYDRKEKVLELASRLNKMGKELAKGDIRLLYHNHDAEFLKVEEGMTAYDVLMKHTDPRYVNFEFDSYWASFAGVDILTMMERLSSRLVLWHVTDRCVSLKDKSFTPIRKVSPTELGRGLLDLKSWFRKAKEIKVEAAIVETHNNFLHDSPLDSLLVSGEYLKKLKEE